MGNGQPGPLVIGIGNPDRGDDAAGRLAAARLKARAPSGARIVECDGEATKLLAQLAETDEAILIDAALSGAAPGTVHRFEAHQAAVTLPAKAGMSTHGFGLAEAIELARTLGQLPKRCVVFAIEARSLDHGAALSPEVEAAVDMVVGEVADLLAEKGA
jgi:hydrogenase maturation protease